MKDLLIRSLPHQKINIDKNRQGDPKLVFISPSKIVRPLLYIVLGILALNWIGILLKFEVGIKSRLLDLIFYKIYAHSEYNFPTLFAFTILLFASLLLYFISTLDHEKKIKNKIFWKFLSLFFLFLALDEAMVMHERIKNFKEYYSFGTSPLLGYAWIFPYSLLALVVGVSSLKFLRRLPKKTRILFITAGIAYWIGAVGGEFAEIFVVEKFGRMDYLPFVRTTEEVLEMGSIVFFIYALLDYLAHMKVSVALFCLSKK